ncbi:MAG TPA: putative peptidoglycan-binding domain-containing protein [Candidatus Paceibacterota bacterium]|jgi:lysozyme family protein|nr:putative peptidoglycan-binding domain-containing protein [Candidatus Paceibacterota bacterium]
MADFEPIVRWVLFQEDDKKEPGKIVDLGDGAGLTRLGITQRYHANDVPSEYFTTMPFAQAVAYAKSVYKKFYWVPIRGDEIQSDIVAAPVFSLAVNNSPSGAVRVLQKVLDIKQDGICGPITINTCNSKQPEIVASMFRAEWEDFYRQIAAYNNQNKFLSGWLARVYFPYPSPVPQIYD